MTEPERINRFEAAYNRIDRALSDMTAQSGERNKSGFAAKVRMAANRRRHLARYKDFLLEAGELRNALVHNRTGGEEYIAVPNEATVLELERIEKLAFSPERVLPRFAGPVACLRPDQSLAEAWALVRDRGFSRFPVYDNAPGSEGFIGLLTSNGFTRWAAAQLHGTRLSIDASTVHVMDVLAHDHRKQSAVFVSRDALIDDVDQLFRDVKPLEAVIITEHGKQTEKPLGMICAADIAALR